MIRSRFSIRVFLALLSPLFAGCDADLPVSPAAAAGFDLSPPAPQSRLRLTVCPTRTTQSVSARIGPAGGSLELAGHRITVPAGALSGAANFTLTAPAGRYVAVLVTAEASQPVQVRGEAAVTISYERCKRQNLTPSSAAAWLAETGSRTTITSLDADGDADDMTLTFMVDLTQDGEDLIVARGIYAVVY